MCLIVAIQAQAGVPNEQKHFQFGLFIGHSFPDKKLAVKVPNGKGKSSRSTLRREKSQLKILTPQAPKILSNNRRFGSRGAFWLQKYLSIYNSLRAVFIAKWKPSLFSAAHYDIYDWKPRFPAKKNVPQRLGGVASNIIPFRLLHAYNMHF